MRAGVISAMPQLDSIPVSPFCANCGLPRDYEHFDESGFDETPERGGEVTLARFELPPQYCGRLENFSQFTDLQGRDLSEVQTPGLRWIIQVNNRPVYPYVNLEHIVNPWGWGSFGVSIRLDENATIEFIVRNLTYPPPGTTKAERIGGRIVGRFWYNPAYGDATPRDCRFK